MMLFRGETSGDFAKCQLFYQATVMATFSYNLTVMVIYLFICVFIYLFWITFKMLNEGMIFELQCTTACSFSNGQ